MEIPLSGSPRYTSQINVLAFFRLVKLMLPWLPFFVFFSAAQALERPTTITLVGLDERGNAVTQEVPLPIYRDTLRSSFSAVHDSLAPALARRSIPATGTRWSLRTISIAIGFAGQIGLGTLWSLTGAAHYHLIYTNSLNPVYPN